MRASNLDDVVDQLQLGPVEPHDFGALQELGETELVFIMKVRKS